MNIEYDSTDKHLEQCPNPSFITDPDTSEKFCQKCGYVIPPEDDESTEHYSSNLDSEILKKHQEKADDTQDNYGLGGVLPTKKELEGLKDSSKKPVKGKNKELFSKVKSDKLGYNFKPVNDYQEITRNIVFRSINDIHKKHTVFPVWLNQTACNNYRKIIEKNNLHKSKNPKRLAAVCMYQVCKNSEKFMITFKELAKDIGEPEEKIRKDYNDVSRKMHEKNIEFTESRGSKQHDRKMKISLEIMYWGNNLHISEILCRKSLKWLDNPKFEQTISGSNEKSIAAGIMCIICETNNLKITPEEIAYEFKISQNTVRNQTKKIATILGVELVDKRKKS